jgi:peptidoglycan/xylan/chitin deacetylase (PgdA/CDA1 family)
MMWKRMRFRLKWLLEDLFAILGKKPDFHQRKGQVEILCFHGVCDVKELLINGRFMQLHRFEALIHALKEHTNILSMADLIANNVDHSRLNVVLTFDDGYRTILTHVLPVLENYQVPATLFVTGRTVQPLWMDLLDCVMDDSVDLGLLGLPVEVVSSNQQIKRYIRTRNPEEIEQITEKLIGLHESIAEKTPHFWKLLDQQELQYLSEHSLITVGNHSLNHYDFTNLSAEVRMKELQQCEAYLKSLGIECKGFFAYPYGASTPEIQHQLREMGYNHQFLADSYESQGGVYGRMVIHPFISLHNQLMAISKGNY